MDIIIQYFLGKCPSCREYVDFSYRGEQEVLEGMDRMLLYDCSNCKTTRSLNSILRGK